MATQNQVSQLGRPDSQHNASPQKTAASEFLTFRLGAKEHGIDILRVQEIRSYEEPTRLAHAPGFIKGVVNLRGGASCRWSTCASSSTAPRWNTTISQW